MTFFPWLDSAHGGDGASRWTGFSVNSTLSGVTPSGRDAYRISTAGPVSLSIPDSASVVVGWKGRLSVLSQDGATFNEMLRITRGSTGINLGVTSSGAVTIRQNSGGGTLLATSAGAPIVVNAWHDWEIRVTLAAATGRCEVWVNGVKHIDFTGDTITSGSLDINTVRFGRVNTGNWDFADIVIDAATVPKGPTMVHYAVPTADGFHIDLAVVGAANRWQAVSEKPPNGDTSYIHGDTEGQKGTFEVGAVPSGFDVLAVQVTHNTRKTDSGVRFVRPILRSGGVDYPGPSESMLESYRSYRESWVEDPDTAAAWTETGRNAVEVGVEIRDS
jgi:hypothetical protein